MEVLLAGATYSEPPPSQELIEPDLLSEAPADLHELLGLLPKADLYLQDEVQFALHPTLTRVWCQKGRRGQRLVEAPGDNSKVYGFGIVDWRDGWFNGLIAPGRTAGPFCEQLKAALARSQERGCVAIVMADNLGTHTERGSLLVRQLLAENRGKLHIVYTPPYDPDANRIEWLWRVSRRIVTHNHQRTDLDTLIEDGKAHFTTLSENPADVLRHIGSPFAPDEQSACPQELAA